MDLFGKEVFGIISTGLAFVSNGAYVISVLRKKTRPHLFSWTIWGLLTGIAFFAQSSADAGPGAWNMAANSIICFIVASLAVWRGNLDIKRSDIISLMCGLAAIPVWYVTKQPLAAVIIVILVEACAYYPTFRKAYAKPHEEYAFTFTIDSLRFLVSLLAMNDYSLTTTLYPVFIVPTNAALVFMIWWRRMKSK